MLIIKICKQLLNNETLEKSYSGVTEEDINNREGHIVFKYEEKVYIFDTTLRDGAQTEGVDFTVSDKIKIAKNLNEYLSIFFIMINSSSFFKGERSISAESRSFILFSVAFRKILQIRA